MTEKELITHIRLLDLYDIDKNHKQFLSHSKANDINHWIELWKWFIEMYSNSRQKEYIKNKMKWLKKSNKELYLKAYKWNTNVKIVK